MNRIIFERDPELVILALILGLAYAFIQYYRNKHQPWGKTLNWVLFTTRAVLASFIAFLLLGPIVKQVNNFYEKPYFVILRDNSASIAQSADSVTLHTLDVELAETKRLLEEKGFATSVQDLEGEAGEKFNYHLGTSDIHAALRRVSNRFEGQKIAGVLLVSDGIYNSGLSPLHGAYNYPVFSIGLGDTTQRSDVSIRNVAYNKIAYQGNKFPLRAEVQVKNLSSQDITISLFKRGKLLGKQTKRSRNDDLLVFDFEPLAEEQGFQKFDLQVEVKTGEHNTRNNRSSVFVEVVEGKKKILLVAPTPHPDIKALREVVGKNSNYEFLLHIPGIEEQQASSLRPEDIDLAIFHQSPDIRGKTLSIFQRFVNAPSSLLLILGQQSDLPMLAKSNMPVRFEGTPRDFDEVTPVANQAFPNFSLSTEANTVLFEFPPVYVHFGKVFLPPSSTPLLFQRVGSVTTEKPLLAIDIRDSKKTGLMLGEGLWRWKLNEFERMENNAAFDELFGKLIQFLSTTDEKRKFRSYPLKQEFSNSEPVIFESQVYNDIFEPVYGNNIGITLTDESGKKTEYSYDTSPGNIRYQIGGLKEGIYRYSAKTSISGKTEQVGGEFAVVELQAELQNLTADFDMLRKIASNTGGKFFPASGVDQLQDHLQQTQAKSIIHSEESYESLINLKWIFWMLMVLATAEWFLRKYYGSY